MLQVLYLFAACLSVHCVFAVREGCACVWKVRVMDAAGSGRVWRAVPPLCALNIY